MTNQFESIDNLEIQKTRLEEEVDKLQSEKTTIISQINETSDILKDMEQSANRLKGEILKLTKEQRVELEKRKEMFGKSASVIKNQLNTEFANYVLALPLFQSLLEQLSSFNQSQDDSYKKTFQLFSLLKEQIESYENKIFIIQDFIYDYEKIVRRMEGDIALTQTLRKRSEDYVKEIETFVISKKRDLERRENELGHKNSVLKDREEKIRQDKEAIKSEWFAIIQAKKEIDKLKAELKD